MADPNLESSLKTRLNIHYRDIFLPPNKKVVKFQPCLKTAASLFPVSHVTFLIAPDLCSTDNKTFFYYNDAVS